MAHVRKNSKIRPQPHQAFYLLAKTALYIIKAFFIAAHRDLSRWLVECGSVYKSGWRLKC
eukprot:scaffold21235_cov20-Prasinocladus_malaysianus.AAC.1